MLPILAILTTCDWDRRGRLGCLFLDVLIYRMNQGSEKSPIFTILRTCENQALEISSYTVHVFIRNSDQVIEQKLFNNEQIVAQIGPKT